MAAAKKAAKAVKKASKAATTTSKGKGSAGAKAALKMDAKCVASRANHDARRKALLEGDDDQKAREKAPTYVIYDIVQASSQWGLPQYRLMIISTHPPQPAPSKIQAQARAAHKAVLLRMKNNSV